MHKIHHKVFLGLAAVAVIAGIVYIANLTRGQVVTNCPPTTVSLNKTNTIYTTSTGDTITYDGRSTLVSNNMNGAFSSDGTNWFQSFDMATLMSKSGIFYYSTTKTIDAATTFTNAKFDIIGASLTFDVVTATTTVVLSQTNPIVTVKGVDLSFDVNTFSLSSKTATFSVDNVKFVPSLGKAELMNYSTLYVKDAAGVVTQISVVADNNLGTLKLSMVNNCTPPVDPCNTTVTMDKTNPTLKTPLSLVIFDGRSLVSDNINVQFSPNNIDWMPKFDANMTAKTGTIYMMDVTTKATYTLTNAVYDAVNGTLKFDTVAPTTTNDVVLSKANTTYVAPDGGDFYFDPGTLSLGSKTNELSADGGKSYSSSLNVDQLMQLTKSQTPALRRAPGREATTVGVVLDPNQGTLTLSFPVVATCGVKDADKDGVADEVDQCPGTVADTVTTLKPNNLAVFNVNGALTWMANIGTAKKPNIVPAKAVSLVDTRGCSCAQIIDHKQTKESIDDKNNEDQGNYNDSDREDNKKRDGEENDSRLKFGCPSLSGKNNDKVTGIVGDWIKKAAKWSDDRKHDDNSEGNNTENDR